MFLHHLPINQLFIDPFSEYIKHYDLMDITCSKFRNQRDPKLFDNRLFIVNSETTDRAQLAKAVDFLASRKVKVLGIDLLFDSLNNDSSDTLLHHALSHSKNTILAYTFQENEIDEISKIRNRSDSFFVGSNVQYYVNLASDDAYTVRSFEPFHSVDSFPSKAFSVGISELYKPEILKEIENRNSKKEWINFRRGHFVVLNEQGSEEPRTFINYPIVPISKFLKDSSLYDSVYFKDKIVLIGFCGEDPESFSLKDRFFTPLNEKPSGRSFPDMHGVIIHANIISMLLDHDYIDEIPPYILHLIAFLIFFINYFIFLRVINAKLLFTLFFIRIIQFVEFLLLLTLSIWLLANFNLKIGFVYMVTSIIISFELFEFYTHKLQYRVLRLLNKLID
ncbi:MAG: CHASE2 domain-containing protein [Saprospiraceae bacterium]